MRNGLFTWLVVLCLGAGCAPPKEKPLSIEEESYAILNQIIEDNDLRISRICVKPLERLELLGKEWSSEFSPADAAFIQQCQDSLAGRSFAPGKLVDWDFRVHDWTPIEIVQADDSSFYDEIAWPLFDQKREKALLHFVSSANGWLSGSGRKVLFVKVRGRWKRWKLYDTWIS
jgi:hypothetical protein